MKKILLLIALCFAFQACTNTARRIADKLQNSQTINVVGVGEISEISAENNDLILVTDASSRCLNYEIIKRDNNKYMIGDNAVTALFSLGVGDDVLDSNIGVVFRFQWDDGKQVDVRFSPSELKARANSISKRVGGI